jgi:two-component system, OmpR family, sensor histidine kinase KdpD
VKRLTWSRFGEGAAECLGAVALATGLVALLDLVAPVTGLTVVYLLGVLLVAIRRGEIAALAAALLSVLAANFFFIEPRHQLSISESENVAALAVFLIAAVVVGRLASAARQRAVEAEARAAEALAREREARMLEAATSSVLQSDGVAEQLRSLAEAVTRSADGALRVDLSGAPSPARGERALRIPVSGPPAWLYVKDEPRWDRGAQERVAAALGRLLDVAAERERLAERQAETEAARRADVAKTAVLHAISHDLRSPLTAITTAASALGDQDLLPDDRRELVQVVQEESRRLIGLIDDVLDLSRIEAGAVDPRPDWCDIREVVARGAAQARAEGEDHPVELALPEGLPLVRADPAQLERVFANLIANAIRFSPAETPVRLSGGVGGGKVTVRVIDRGRGVPPSQRQRIFEPFFRGSEPGQGSGLGLAICRGFVEANGGTIKYRRAGDETAFSVAFPLVRQPAAA